MKIYFIVLLIYLLSTFHCTVTWVQDDNVASGYIEIINNTLSYSSSQFQTFTFTPTQSNLGRVALSVNAFTFPPTTMMSFWISNRTQYTTTTYSFVFSIQQQSVIYRLILNYMKCQDKDSYIINMESNTSRLRSGSSMRSDSFYTSTKDKSEQQMELGVVISAFKASYNGSSTFYLKTLITQNNFTIVCTFITKQNNIITELQYDIIVYNKLKHLQTAQSLWMVGVYQMNAKSVVGNQQYFGGILERYKQDNRMFFGVNQYNYLTKKSNEFLVATNSFNDLTTDYTFKGGLQSIGLQYIFFAKRSCSSSQFFCMDTSDPSNDDCVSSCSASCSPAQFSSSSGNLCQSCDNKCQTCDKQRDNCTDCFSDSNRELKGNSCVCKNLTDGSYSYIQTNQAVCPLCSDYIPGCLNCTSTSVCSVCDTLHGFQLVQQVCSCPPNLVSVSGWCTQIIGCLSMANSSSCTLCNFKKLFDYVPSDMSCTCSNATFLIKTENAEDSYCFPICGDNYVHPQEKCDDGNTESGDGCSYNCSIETDFVCYGKLGDGSLCRQDIDYKITYMTTYRIPSTHTCNMILQISPIDRLFTEVNFSDLLTTSFMASNETHRYLPDKGWIIFTLDYLQDLEDNTEQFIINLTAITRYNMTIYTDPFVIAGVNLQMTYDDDFDLIFSEIMWYIVLVLTAMALLISIVSIAKERFLGIQLIQTYQWIFFLTVTLKKVPVEFNALQTVLSYSNAYNLNTLTYQRAYNSSPEVIRTNFSSQFLVNFNILFLVLIANWLISVILIVLKVHYEKKADQAFKQNQNFQQFETIKDCFAEYLQVIFNRVLIFVTSFSAFQLIFSFSVQVQIPRSGQGIFEDYLNAMASVFCFFYMVIIVFVLILWNFFKPNVDEDDEPYLGISFSYMDRRYPILYFCFQIVMIIILSGLYEQFYVLYILISLQALYIALLFIIPTYKHSHFHRISLIFNEAIKLFFAIVCMVKNTFDVNQDMLAIISICMLVGGLFICNIFTVIRLIILFGVCQFLKPEQKDVVLIDEQTLRRSILNKDQQQAHISQPPAEQEPIQKPQDGMGENDERADIKGQLQLQQLFQQKQNTPINESKNEPAQEQPQTVDVSFFQEKKNIRKGGKRIYHFN